MASTPSQTLETVLITGGSRGIGFALVQQYLEQGYHVITTYTSKHPPKCLSQMNHKTLTIIHADFTDKTSENRILDIIGDRKLDLIIHNACYFPNRGNRACQLNSTEWLKAFQVNTVFPILLTARLIQNLKQAPHPKVVFLSSRRGSNSINIKDQYRGRYEYRTTKAALNAAVIALNNELEPLGIYTLLIHPGRVATALTHFDGIPPSQSAASIVPLINKLSQESTGQFIDVPSGRNLPW